jgi:hypothetical protein
MTEDFSKIPIITFKPQQPKPIEVFIPDDVFIDYADTFTVQRTPQEIIISFLQTQFPIALTDEADSKIEAIECVCLARIALTPDRFEIFLKLLQDSSRLQSESQQSS